MGGSAPDPQYAPNPTNRLYNLAYCILLDQAEAEDLVQETFLHVYLALPHSQTDRPFRPWVTAVLLNACRSALRKKRPLLFSEMTSRDQDEDSFMQNIPSEDEPAIETVEKEQLENALRLAMATLPEEERSRFWVGRLSSAAISLAGWGCFR